VPTDCEVVTDPATFVAALSIQALEPTPAVAAILDQWGIRTVGELQALGPSAVTDRLGLEALALFAAADTHSTRPLRLVKPAEQFTETYDFEEPVETLEPVLFLFRRFVDQLSRRLAPSGLVAGELRWQLRLESGQTLDRTITVPDPTRHPDVLFRILHTQMETVRTDAAVVGVTLTLQPGRPLTRQFTLFQAVLRDPGQLQETLGRLSALLGSDRVGSPVRLPGHARDSFRLEPPDFEQPAHPEPPRPALVQPVPWRRLRPAPVAQVDTAPVGPRAAPDATPQPKAVRSPVVAGRLKVTLGPWRASGRWWEPGAWAREDWEVETTDGTAVRLSRTDAGWHVTDLLD
jgi:protein ImuB